MILLETPLTLPLTTRYSVPLPSGEEEKTVSQIESRVGSLGGCADLLPWKDCIWSWSLGDGFGLDSEKSPHFPRPIHPLHQTGHME